MSTIFLGLDQSLKFLMFLDYFRGSQRLEEPPV
ncbi:hypothetical protein BN1263170314 [Stenotrophomonas maltophilia]|nr:hypothetical protein BN1263170314 [Stenotrophomonas maltophilia]